MSEPQDQEQTKAEGGKVGVYICYCGGNISDHVDVEQVRQRMEELPGVAKARTNMFMCSDPGQEMIMQDLQSGEVDRVVVASCAPSLHETTFRGAIDRAGANPYIYEHANIREQVSWVHHGDQATDKAFRLISAAAAKAGQLKPLQPIRVDAQRHATVIGGGVAGLRAALSLAQGGIEVTLLEKTPFLGGRLAQLHRVAPTGDLASELITQLTDQILASDLITVHTCAQVAGFEGYIGNFKLTVRQSPPEASDLPTGLDQTQASEAVGNYFDNAGVLGALPPTQAETLTLDTGVIILATGFKNYTPRSDEYGYGSSPQVLTLPQMIAKLKEAPADGQLLQIDGRPIRSMALIHCVGSRQIPGIHPEDEDGQLNQYCSRTCCTALLNTANQVRQEHPGTRVYEYYRDIRTYGRGQEDLYEEAARSGVVFLRFEADDPPQVSPEGAPEDYPLLVKVTDTLTFGEEVTAPVDLVVLATGMEPNDVSDLVEMMKLPKGADRFLLEVHPKLRPVELPVGGILLAGTCQAPFDVGESCNAAGAAAVKAAAILGRGYVELDPFVAQVDLDKCQGHGACVEACLNEGALSLVEMEIGGQKVSRAEVTPAMCLGCGACVAVCPENAIEINGWTLKQYEAMVEAIVAGRAAA